jgi:8-oxo-dGTP diphosphatase
MRDPKILPKHWMMIAACGIVYEGGKLLVLRDVHGFWSGVSGWIEPGESPGQTIIREAREELGVEATVTRHFRPFIDWHVAEHGDPISFLLFPHRLKLASTDFTLDPAEVSEVAWVTPSELPNLDMLAHPRTLFEDRLEEWLAP